MNSLHAFIKCLAIMAVSLTNKDVGGYREAFTQWLATAKPFLTKHGLYAEFKEEAKLFLQKKMEFDADDSAAVSGLLKTFIPAFQKDLSIGHEELALVRDIALFYRKDSDPAWKRISKNIALLRDPELNKEFLPEDDESETTYSDSTCRSMEKIVKALVNRSGDPILTLAEMRDLRETHPKEITRYSELRKEFVAAYRSNLQKFVRMRGTDLVDVKLARDFLTKKGCNYIPNGFVGKINESGILHTRGDRAIKGFLMGEVVMNPAYDYKKDNTYVCSLKSNMTQQLRTGDFIAEKKKERFEKVAEFAKSVEKYRKAWIRDLDALDDHTRLMATLTEAIFLTQARIGGNSTNKDDEDRYGMSTILVEHCKLMPNGLDIRYVGKKGTPQEHFIRTNTPSGKKVVSLMKALMKGKKPNQPVFTERGKMINGQTVNKYLRELGVPNGISIHKFRHVLGSSLAIKILEGCPLERGVTQSVAEKWIKDAFIPIGEMLKHRAGVGVAAKTVSSTSINAYVDPQLLKNWFSDLGLRVPKWVPRT